MVDIRDDEGAGNGETGLPWPEEYQELKPLIRESWGLEGEVYLNRLLSGLSGAMVFAADVTGREFTGQAILKLDRVHEPWASGNTEAERHHRAFEAGPDFAARHLPKILHMLNHGGALAILSTIAGRGLEYAVPWANCPYDRQLDAVRQLSIGLLDDWNADYRLAEGMLGPEDLLQGWLGYRIDPAEGRIHGFLESDCGLTAEMPSFVFEGHWYPNPLAFATTAAAASRGLRLRALKGNIHGDLHGFNVLVPAPHEGGPNYYLIDLALYDDDQFLFYDHAYFELSHLLRVREDASLAAWKMLLDTPRLLKESQKHIGLIAEDLGLVQTVNTWRQGVTDWAERHESHRLSYVESQYLLARVAVGLNFVNKQLAPEQRRMAFLYAASDLKNFLKFNRLDWPKHGPSLWSEGALPGVQAGPVSSAHAVHPMPVAASTAPETGPPDEAPAPAEPCNAAPDEATEPGADAPSRRVGPMAWAAAAALLAVALAVGLWVWRPWAPGAETAAIAEIDFPLPSRPSVVVLPFDPLSPGIETEMLAAGMTATITAALAQVPELFVTSRSAAAAFKNRAADPREVMAAFDVRYVLEGSLQESNDRVRVTAELIDATTAENVWAERYDRDADDIFALQDEIALRVLVSLQVKLTEGFQAAMRGESTNNVQAYLLYVQARNAYRQLTKDSLAETRRLTDEVLKIDPGYRQALVLKAWTHVMDANLGYGAEPEISLEMAARLLESAAAADGSLSDAEQAEILIIDAYINQIEGRYDEAITTGREAVDLAPNNADLLATYGEILSFSGEFSQSIVMFQEAFHHSPTYPSWYPLYLSRNYAFLGDMDRAVTWAVDGLARAESNRLRVLNLANLAFAYEEAGRGKEAKQAAADLRALAPDFTLAAYREIQPYRHDADWQRYADALRKAGIS